jgi:hypothetical protein
MIGVEVFADGDRSTRSSRHEAGRLNEEGVGRCSQDHHRWFKILGQRFLRQTPLFGTGAPALK